MAQASCGSPALEHPEAGLQAGHQADRQAGRQVEPTATCPRTALMATTAREGRHLRHANAHPADHLRPRSPPHDGRHRARRILMSSNSASDGSERLPAEKALPSAGSTTLLRFLFVVVDAGFIEVGC